MVSLTYSVQLTMLNIVELYCTSLTWIAKEEHSTEDIALPGKNYVFCKMYFWDW